MLMGVSVFQLYDNMFAHLRSRDGVLAKYQFLLEFISKKMRTNVCANVSPLSGLDPSNEDVAKMLAEIHMREFACIMKTLDQVHGIAARYHEDAFDNTDAYIGLQFVQLPPHEMTGEQRHASRLLLGVGQSHSEINAALKSIGLSRGDIMGHNSVKMSIVAEQFQNARTVAEDAFDCLHHMSKKVWSLVNMLAFSNLFRFADPRQPICIPNPDDAIFIPRIPMQQTPMHDDHEEDKEEQEQEQEQEQEPEPTPEVVCKVCNDCGKKVDTMKMHHRMGLNPTDAYLCHPCGFKREFPDEYIQEFPDDEESEEEESEEPEEPEESEESAAPAAQHVPGYKLPVEERMKKFDEHKFGLCVSCDAGLDEPNDFMRDPVTFTPGLMCHDCIHYYSSPHPMSPHKFGRCEYIQEFPDDEEPEEEESDHEESDEEESEDEELSLRAATLAPFVNVPELGERNTKSRSHKFGRCEYCHAGLDDRADFICHTPTNVGFALMCNACHEQRNPGRAPDTTNFEF